jgi:hypothetical protein
VPHAASKYQAIAIEVTPMKMSNLQSKRRSNHHLHTCTVLAGALSVAAMVLLYPVSADAAPPEPQKPAMYTCDYNDKAGIPQIQLTLDGKVRYGKERFVDADSFKIDSGQAEYFLTRADGNHFIGFDLQTGKGSDAVEKNGFHTEDHISCMKTK